MRPTSSRSRAQAAAVWARSAASCDFAGSWVTARARSLASCSSCGVEGAGLWGPREKPAHDAHDHRGAAAPRPGARSLAGAGVAGRGGHGRARAAVGGAAAARLAAETKVNGLVRRVLLVTLLGV